MRNILGNIFELGRKIKYRTMFLLRPLFVQKRKPTLTTSVSFSNSTPPNQKSNIWWRDKRIIIAGCGLFVVAVILALVIPTQANKSALTSVNNSIAFNGDNLQESSTTSDGFHTDEAMSLNMTESEIVDTSNIDSIIQKSTDLSETETPETSPLPTTAPDDVPLMPGVHDSRIIEIQERLMELDYLDEDEPTDYYGNGTEYALQLFQRKSGLQVDGLLGDQTLAALYSEEALPYTVKLGDRGTDVTTMQERLQELNYLKAGSTGYFGTDTEAAVKSFQQRNGLSADGNVGEYTREVLYSEDAKAAKTTTSSTGGTTGGGTTIAVGNPDEASVEKLIKIAKSKLGCNYTRGGKGPDEFDCSGFVYYCLNTAGYSIKYMTSSGWAKCSLPKVTNMSDMKRGDIICFSGHVGIYMGDGQMIDAGSSDDQVRICSNIMSSKYWTSHFICARRVF